MKKPTMGYTWPLMQDTVSKRDRLRMAKFILISNDKTFDQSIFTL